MSDLSRMKVLILMNWVALSGGYGSAPLDRPLVEGDEEGFGSWPVEIEEEEEDLSSSTSVQREETAFQALLNEEDENFSEVFAIAAASLSHIAQLKEVLGDLGDSSVSDGGSAVQEMQRLTDLMCTKFQEMKAFDLADKDPDSVAAQAQRLMGEKKHLEKTVQDLQAKLSEKERELNAYKKSLDEIDKSTMSKNPESVEKKEYRLFGQSLMNPPSDEDSDNV